MPLSPPAARQPMHARTVECQGFRREDGLWDIEGRLLDTKAYGFDNADRASGRVEAGEPLHLMLVRLTIDDDFLIRRAEAVIEAGPFIPCHAAAAPFAALEGMRIGPGFRGEVRKRFGGVNGCTHIVELLGPMATTAYQTLYPVREKRAAEAPARERPKIIDTCQAMAADGPVVKRLWPEFYEGPERAD